MINISREAEVNLINILIDQDVISGKDLANIKKISSEENKKDKVEVTTPPAIEDALTLASKLKEIEQADDNLDIPTFLRKRFQPQQDTGEKHRD